jgi:hypothetical protein
MHERTDPLWSNPLCMYASLDQLWHFSLPSTTKHSNTPDIISRGQYKNNPI